MINKEKFERAISTFARAPSPGLIVTSSTLAISHRKQIVKSRYFVTDGGLISYGPDQVNSFRRAAGYIDRILKGEKPADLPVQAPTKYELVINLKTASSLGLGVPPLASRPRRRGDRMMGWMAPLRHLGAKVLVGENQSADKEPSMNEITTVGLDLAKNVFQVHGVDAAGATVLRKQLRRAQVLAFFSWPDRGVNRPLIVGAGSTL